MIYKLHYIGSRLYPEKVFITEVKRLGVNRCLPIRLVKNLKWGEKILLATFKPKVIEEPLPEYSFNAKTFLGMNMEGRLRGKVIQDGDITGNRPDFFLMEGIHKQKAVWIPKAILADSDTLDLTPKIDNRKNKTKGTADVFGYFIVTGLNLTASEYVKKQLKCQLEVVSSSDKVVAVQRQCGNYSISGI